jgi:hypothetical protein
VLVSESDMPLYDPLTFHQQLLSESKSRLTACNHTSRHQWRWSSEMNVGLGATGGRSAIATFDWCHCNLCTSAYPPAQPMVCHLPYLLLQTPHMNVSHWRKSSQWIGLTWGHVEAVLRDEEVYRS